MSNNYLGSVTILFKGKIPDIAKAIPRVEILSDNTVYIPYASTTPRIRSIDFTINGNTHSLSEKTVQKVTTSKNEIIFGN